VVQVLLLPGSAGLHLREGKNAASALLRFRNRIVAPSRCGYRIHPSDGISDFDKF
jgi:hypothetical protein